MSVAALSWIICDTCLVFPDKAKKEIILSENKGISYQLIIHNVPEDIFAIKADDFPDTRAFFTGDKNKRADYIIISSSLKLIVFLELKHGSGGSETDIVKQLKGAECLLKYCDLLHTKMSNSKSTLQHYKFRFVCAYFVGASKRPTRYQGSSLHDAPERMLKLNNPHRLFLKQLRGQVRNKS